MGVWNVCWCEMINQFNHLQHTHTLYPAPRKVIRHNKVCPGEQWSPSRTLFLKVIALCIPSDWQAITPVCLRSRVSCC